MMKAFITLAVVCLIACALASPVDLNEEQKAKAKAFFEECIKEENISVEEAMKLHKREFTNTTANMKCFGACFLEKVGILKDNQIQEAVASEKLSAVMGEENAKIVLDKCKNIQGENRCDTGFKIYQCYQNVRAELIAECASPFELNDEQQAKVKASFEECVKEENISVEEAIKLHKKEFTNASQNMKCFGACFFEKAGILKDNQFQEAVASEKLSAVIGKEKTKIVLEKCKAKAVQGENRCDTGFKIYQCAENIKAEFAAALASVKASFEECAKEENISVEEAIKLRNREFTNASENMKCFGACFFEKAGILKDNQIQEAVASEKLSAIIGEENTKAVLEKCKAVQGENRCDTGFKTYQCYQNARAELTAA